MFEYIVLTLVVIAACYYFIPTAENYKSCLNESCEGTLRMNNTSFINPFIWPYSASERINDLHFASEEERKYYGFGAGPLTNQTEPDHVVLTGGHY